MYVQSYMFFDGRTEEALDFYQSAIGARIDMMLRFRDHPESLDHPGMPADFGAKVMHASFRVGDTHLMASDGMCSGKPGFKGITLSIATASDDEAERVFAALSDGATIDTPMESNFFSSRFGSLTDRFGVSWMVTVVPANERMDA